MSRVEKRRQLINAARAAEQAKPGLEADSFTEQQMLIIQQSLGLAQQHYTAGRLPQAEDIFLQILQDIPIHPVALHMLGLIAHHMGENDIVVHLITQAVTIAPDYTDAHYNLGKALRKIGKLDEAIASFRMAIANEPDYAGAHCNLGSVFNELGQLDEAVASYHKALAINPDYAEAHNNLGNALRDLGMLNEAVASFRKAIAIKPDYATAHSNLGLTHQDLGSPDEALASYQKALDLNPESAEAQYRLGIIYRDLGQEQIAIPFFKEAGIRDSGEELLRCLYKSKKFEEFNENLKAVSKKNPASALVSSLSVHASVNFNQPDNYNFCRRPLDFAYQNRFECLFENDEKLLQNLLRDIRVNKKNNRSQSILKFGEQSSGNLFNYPEPSFACLPDLIMAEIERYRAFFKGEECLLFSQWPKKTNLKGWYVRMQSGGHLDAHIHELGWVSGTIYLSLPENVSNDEGKIQLGLHGNNYPLMHENFPTKILPIKTGDIVFFPASTFHRTIPFSSDEERICIAFDINSMAP